jgi:ubiquinone/menaquinone biosynthesis C-methylase UbiE
MIRKFRGLFFKAWYWYISAIDKNAEVIFMNFGYSDKSKKIIENEIDEKNRYSIQLYHHTASPVDLSGKDILEVGCGRGGGLSYVRNHLLPKTAVGVDLNGKAIQFCKQHYKFDNISFQQANAQALPFPDNSFDVVLNVESSHRYPQVDLFFNEVSRVLKPGGYFLFTDFRNFDKIEELERQLVNSNLRIETKTDITANVVEALELATPHREQLIRKIAPRLLHELCRNFAATIGTPTYNKFLNRKMLYVSYVLRN